MALAGEKVEPYVSLKTDFEKYKEEMHLVRSKLSRKAS